MRSKVVAATLILLTILGTGSWHVEIDDPDFLPQPATHDHSTHHEAFRTPGTADGTGHCAICHWLQMFRAGQVRAASLHDRPVVDGLSGRAAAAPLPAAALLGLPSRAPPA
jgi:hypothetical protein